MLKVLCDTKYNISYFSQNLFSKNSLTSYLLKKIIIAGLGDAVYYGNKHSDLVRYKNPGDIG